jgi:ATP-dependent DNA helicase RecG
MQYPGVESSTLEFKKELPKNDQIIKTIIGFCNQHGGRLVVGVSNDGTICGIPEEQAAHAIEQLSKAIYEASAPPILPLVYTQRIGDNTILVIEVSAGTNKPYFKKSEGLDQGTYVRLGPTTLRANADLIEELKWQMRGKSYDFLPVYQTTDIDLNDQEIKQFIQSRENRKLEPVTKDLLFSYYLIAQEHAQTYATVAGILMFGKRPQYYLPEAFIICTHFKGVEGREAIATIDCTGTLFEQFHTAMNFIVSRLSRSFTIKARKREETLEIPEKAIREVLLNAIVHRNYHLKSPVKIAIFNDRIEFFSPGTLPGPLNLQNLKSGISYIRNIAICKVFREAHYMEKLGSGFLTLFHSYEERNLKTPVVIEGENFVKCILPRTFSETSDEDPILQLFHVGSKITVSDVVKHLKLSRTTAGRRLNALVHSRKIQKIGKGRGAGYKRIT